MESESVWDYPRPPRLEPFLKKIEIKFGGESIATTSNAFRILETSHPPVYYIPQQDIKMQYLKPASGSSFCEWKGKASYWDIEVGDKRADRVAWSYAGPTDPFAAIKDHLAFYAHAMESCTVDGEIVMPQPGSFYGGWITSNLIGPFKGGPGTQGW
jgi:uncharacterized protein (DUF427 family)